MSNNLTDFIVQQFKKSFELSQFGAQLVQTANFLGYFCMAIPAALVMRRWGYKAGMVMGLVLGENTKLAGSLLVMAIVGGAIFPPILGWIAKSAGSLAKGYIVPCVGFSGVTLYGLLVNRVLPECDRTS